MSDEALVIRLRAGDEAAFVELVRAEHGRLLRLARNLCRGCRATAEEVVQESWLAVLGGLGRYNGQARLGAWIAGIVMNKARSRAARDARMVPFSALVPSGGEAAALLDIEDDGLAAAEGWHMTTPERLAADREMLRHLMAAMQGLPPMQRAVVTLRDVEGRDGAEVCASLGLTDANMRVLLHRGRAGLRIALAPLRGSAPAAPLRGPAPAGPQPRRGARRMPIARA